MLSKKFRITEEYIFRKHKKKGKRKRTHFFQMSYLPNTYGYPRFGFITTKKVGGAVHRHRVSRCMREAARTLLPHLRGYDMVFVIYPSLLTKKTPGVAKVLKEAFIDEGMWVD